MILNFKDKHNEKVTFSLKTFSDMIDVPMRYIIQQPHVTSVEIVGFLVDRLARFIAVNRGDHAKLIEVAVTTLHQRYRKYSQK